MSRMNKYLCGTPEKECSGAMINSTKLRKFVKCHSTREEAFACHVKYLIANGYERVGPREFRAPEGGILVLTKKTKFGGKFMKGKEDRVMPDRKNGVIY